MPHVHPCEASANLQPAEPLEHVPGFSSPFPHVDRWRLGEGTYATVFNLKVRSQHYMSSTLRLLMYLLHPWKFFPCAHYADGLPRDVTLWQTHSRYWARNQQIHQGNLQGCKVMFLQALIMFPWSNNYNRFPLFGRKSVLPPSWRMGKLLFPMRPLLVLGRTLSPLRVSMG